MKVSHKFNPIRNDCFDATEGDIHVRIAAHRHIILVDVTQGNESRGFEIDLITLHRLLRDEIRRVYAN